MFRSDDWQITDFGGTYPLAQPEGPHSCVEAHLWAELMASLRLQKLLNVVTFRVHPFVWSTTKFPRDDAPIQCKFLLRELPVLMLNTFAQQGNARNTNVNRRSKSLNAPFNVDGPDQLASFSQIYTP